MSSLLPHKHAHRVYCAGPLFNEAERREMVRIGYVLRRAGFEPFLPHADGMEFAQVHPFLTDQGHDPADAGLWLHRAVFALDVYQVVLGCGSLVFNANGRVPDEGGVAETTMAWMLGKPVVVYKDDVRSAVAGRDNPLIVGQTGFCTVGDLELLPGALREAIAQRAPVPDQAVPCPPHLEETLRSGERLWTALAAMGPDRPVDGVATLVLDLFREPIPASGVPGAS